MTEVVNVEENDEVVESTARHEPSGAVAMRSRVGAVAAIPRIVIAHPSSLTHVRETVIALLEQGMLEYFATAYLDHPEYRLARHIKAAARAVRPSLVRQIERRSFPGVPFAMLRTKPFWEICRSISSVIIRSPVLSDAIWERAELAFDRWVARGIGDTIDAVYTYEHAALATLHAAKRRGVYCFYEQPSQHHTFFSRVYRTQAERYPEILNAASALTADSKSARRNQRRDQELAAADCIVCNSSFTRRTLIDAGIDTAKIEVTPLGFPSPEAKPYTTDGPVIFMNAGTQNLRKGLHLLYRAWRALRLPPTQGELWLIGRMELPEALRQGLPGRVRIMDSIPRSELLQVYRNASVFVLPSLADGFGMVITEAMSRGVPVITTENTAAPDIIEHGRTGFIVPAGDEDALRLQMRWCVEHKHELAAIGGRALAAASRWQWSDYRAAITAIMQRRIHESHQRA